MEKQTNNNVYLMNEVAIPGAEYGVNTASQICTKCGKLKKDCDCKK